MIPHGCSLFGLSDKRLRQEYWKTKWRKLISSLMYADVQYVFLASSETDLEKLVTNFIVIMNAVLY